jgi:ABC-type nitrate/sulfonate/bicarbonate transport system substrate-binding protein
MTPTNPATTEPGSAFRLLTGASSRRRFLASTGLGALGLAALAACGGTEAQPAGQASPSAAGASSVAPGAYGTLSLQLSWIKNIEFAGEFFADSKGYYTEAGFEKVDLVTGPVDSADTLVSTGTIDVGLSAPDATARLITEQGADLVIIGSTFQKNPFCILSLEEGKPIRTVADLAGKTIGIQAGTNQSIFEGFCKANNVDTSTFTTTVVQFEPTPLTEKKVDGFMAYTTNEPFLVKADGFTPVTLPFADNGLPLTAETFCVTKAALAADRDKFKAFLKAEIKGWYDAVADPEAGAKLAVDTYGKGLGLEYDSQLEQLKAQNELVVSADTKTNGLFTLTDELIAQIIGAIAAVGITITAEELFDMSLVKEIYAAEPDLIKA